MQSALRSSSSTRANTLRSGFVHKADDRQGRPLSYSGVAQEPAHRLNRLFADMMLNALGIQLRLLA